MMKLLARVLNTLLQTQSHSHVYTHLTCSHILSSVITYPRNKRRFMRMNMSSELFISQPRLFLTSEGNFENLIFKSNNNKKQYWWNQTKNEIKNTYRCCVSAYHGIHENDLHWKSSDQGPHRYPSWSSETLLICSLADSIRSHHSTSKEVVSAYSVEISN